MTLTSYESLGRWFMDSKGTEAAPHWNLYAIDYGQTEKLIGRYVKGDDLEASGKHLERMIRDLNNPDGSKFRVMVYAPGKHNNSNAQAYVQIYEKSQAPASAPAGIGGLPVGVGSIDQYVSERLKTERLQWELDALKEQINAPSNTWERIVDTASAIPGIADVLKIAAIGFIGKLNPGALPDIMKAINGMPQAQPPGDHDADDDTADPQAVFINNANEAAMMLGTDPITMMKKFNLLVKANPDAARQLMQQ